MNAIEKSKAWNGNGESTILSWLIREGLDAKVTTESRHAGKEWAMLELEELCYRHENNNLYKITITHPVARTSNQWVILTYFFPLHIQSIPKFCQLYFINLSQPLHTISTLASHSSSPNCSPQRQAFFWPRVNSPSQITLLKTYVISFHFLKHIFRRYPSSLA